MAQHGKPNMCGLFVWFAGLGNPSFNGQFVPFIERAISCPAATQFFCCFGVTLGSVSKLSMLLLSCQSGRSLSVLLNSS